MMRIGNMLIPEAAITDAAFLLSRTPRAHLDAQFRRWREALVTKALTAGADLDSALDFSILFLDAVVEEWETGEYGYVDVFPSMQVH